MSLVLALALGIMGCSGSSGGVGGEGGTAGDGGFGGAGPPVAGIWTGHGDCWAICFTVNEAGDALIQGDTAGSEPLQCQQWALDAAFYGCGWLSWADVIPIVDGSFEQESSNVVQGQFLSSTRASGTFENSTDGCSAEWVARPGVAEAVPCSGADNTEPCASFCDKDEECFALEQQLPWCRNLCGDELELAGETSARCREAVEDVFACVANLSSCELVEDWWYHATPGHPCEAADAAVDAACL